MKRNRNRKVNRNVFAVIGSALFLAANVSVADDSVEITLESTVTGNQEQPKVLYIVPWQAPEGPELLRQNLQPDISDLFQPVNRDEFVRQLNYRQRYRQTIGFDDYLNSNVNSTK